MWQKVTTVTPTSPGLLSLPPCGGGSGWGVSEDPLSDPYFSIGAPIRLPHSVHDPS
jgi:hypothetical protein